ncbi:protein aurora borealis-like [Asterias rubens]|uniref:protein aurora borealis-like n=1 Tax=Asterias rubens TaxID=7604 RepID=UPI0014558C33|nr:protein aurora borealis-like [Asterias rubens]
MDCQQKVPPDSSMSSKNTTLNPFEADSVDSLHLTQFSPSVFSKSVLTPSSSQSKGKFRWSIDHLAVLHPADIDEYPVQQESTFDSDTEERAQQAIDQFFSQQHIVPSPWSVKKPLKHVTFSPNPPTISEDSVECSPQVNMSTRQQDRVEVSCQTTVSLPMDFDLLAVLGDRFNQEDKEADECNELSTSTLRRKLFSIGESSPTVTAARGGLNDEHSPETIPDIPSPQVSPIRQVDDSTLSSSDISLVNTPESVQSQFSSSPISSKMTPGRWTPCRQGSTSTGLMCSPAFSPISGSVYSPATDSPQLVLNSSNTSGAPSSGLLLPEASPIFANPQSKSSEMLLAPSSEEIMAMSFCASDVEFEKNPTSVADKIDDVPMTDFLQASDLLTVRDPTDLSDSNDHSDSIDSESSSPDAASSSMCSMEQSYVFNPSKCSDDLTCSGTQPSEDHLFLDDDQEMLNPVGSSMYSSDDIPSFQVDESMRHQLFTSRKQLTSTLKLVPSNTSSVLSAIPTTSKSHLGLDGTHLDLDGSSPEPDGKFIHQKSVTLGGFPAASPRSKVIQREVTPMQADSGFNTQSFTSMEVTDSDVIDIMQTNEYSVDGYPMNDKETIRSNIMR